MQKGDLFDEKIGELIGHGAEAKVWKVIDSQGIKTAVKVRLVKKYRHPKLDEKINVARVKSQAKILTKVLSNNIHVPKVLKVINQQNKIIMQYIEGQKLKDYLNQHPQNVEQILNELAKSILKLHQLNIIHGDLTTSNMIFQEKDKIYLIDFGLSSISSTIEDKAVDLYLFEKAFIATHPQLEQKFVKFLQFYGEKKVLDRLEVVRQRGRKKVAFG